MNTPHNPTPAQLYHNVTTTVKLRGQDVKIHGLCTGTVAVKTNFRSKKGPGPLAKLNILLDPNYTQYLPIWVWVIEHPGGVVVIDTGENAAVNNLDRHLAGESRFMRFQFRNAAKFDVDKNHELDRQLATVGLTPADVRLVVLTHLHLDHTDGLRFFPRHEIMVGAHEYRHADSHMPSTWPRWFKPNKVEYRSGLVEVFDRAYAITGDLLYIPTPGHTRGHSSVLFKTDTCDIIFAGDTSYNQDQVFRNELAGVNASFRQTLQTYQHLRTYTTLRPAIYLPTHDEGAGERLVKLEGMLPKA